MKMTYAIGYDCDNNKIYHNSKVKIAKFPPKDFKTIYKVAKESDVIFTISYPYPVKSWSSYHKEYVNCAYLYNEKLPKNVVTRVPCEFLKVQELDILNYLGDIDLKGSYGDTD